MPFAKGNTYGGRPKGSKSKTTESIRQAFLEAFERMGGIKSLLKWGKENPTEFYRLLSKVLPKEVEVSGPGGGPVQTVIEVQFATGQKNNS